MSCHMIKPALCTYIEQGLTLITPSFMLHTQVYNRPPPDPAVIAEYEALPVGATPHSLIDASLVARNDADIEVMSKAFTGDREGYANTHRQPTAETMTRHRHRSSPTPTDLQRRCRRLHQHRSRRQSNPAQTMARLARRTRRTLAPTQSR